MKAAFTSRFTLAALALAATFSLNPAAHGAQAATDQAPAGSRVAATEAMPVAQQNALVQKYCAVCHEDAHMNGGLSLQHFDAAHPDPGEAAMMVSKLKTGAIGAAGLPRPDKSTTESWISAMSAEAAGADRWNISQTPADQGFVWTANIVESLPSSVNAAQPDLFRLKLTCHVDTREAGMQLSWAPGSPPQDQVMSAAADGQVPSTYKIEGTEKMAIGGTSGPGAIILYSTGQTSAPPKPAPALPLRTLTITNLFPGETIVFPFADLPESNREALSPCFGSKSGQ